MLCPLQKSCNKAETTKSEQVMERPQHLSIAGWENGSEEMYISGNGVGGETDTAYYSPISWKSISPELSPDNSEFLSISRPKSNAISLIIYLELRRCSLNIIYLNKNNR